MRLRLTFPIPISFAVLVSPFQLPGTGCEPARPFRKVLGIMRQYHLDSAVARVTGESLRTIQQRGFGLVRPESERSSRRATTGSSASGSQPPNGEQLRDNFLRHGTDL